MSNVQDIAKWGFVLNVCYTRRLALSTSLPFKSQPLEQAPFSNNSVAHWLNNQLRLDLYKARQKESLELKKIRPYKQNTEVDITA